MNIWASFLLPHLKCHQLVTEYFCLNRRVGDFEDAKANVPLKNNHRMHPQRMVWRTFLRCVSAVWLNEMAFCFWNGLIFPPPQKERVGFMVVAGSKLFGAVGQRFLLIFALKIWGNDPI